MGCNKLFIIISEQDCYCSSIWEGVGGLASNCNAERNVCKTKHIWVFWVFFLSDTPAVTVTAEMILQDVCERKRSNLIWVFYALLFKCFISTLISNTYNEMKLSYRQKPKFGLKVCLSVFSVRWCHFGILLVHTLQFDFALMLGSNRKADTLLSYLNSLLNIT